MLSASIEDYAKAIYVLEERHGVASTTALAERLGDQPAGRLGHGQEARGARVRDPRPLPRRQADGRGAQGRAGGAAPPPAARDVPGRGARRPVGPRACRGGGARARPLGGARGAHRRQARRADARSARRPDPRAPTAPSSSPRRSRWTPSPPGPGRFVRVSDSDPKLLRELADLGIRPGDELEVVAGGVRAGSAPHRLRPALARGRCASRSRP